MTFLCPTVNTFCKQKHLNTCGPDAFDEAESIRYRIEETQGEIYQLAFTRGWNLEDFSSKYLRSDFCRLEMDAVYSPYQLELVEACMAEIEAEFQRKGIQIRKRTESSTAIDVSPAWIGRMYRGLFYTMREMSASIAESVPFQTLAQYEPELENEEIEDAAVYITEQLYEQEQSL